MRNLLSKIWLKIRSFSTREKPTSHKAVMLPRGMSRGLNSQYLGYLASLQEAADVVYKKYAKQRAQWLKRPKVRMGAMVRVLPGGRHALFESNVGIIRKPLTA